MGPEDPSGVRKMARSWDAKAAIVDANDLGVAWAVGYSSGVDPCLAGRSNVKQSCRQPGTTNSGSAGEAQTLN